ncbi:AbrB family transcriptional regulator [Lutibaculum baratangense]|uniref:Ammonia monooxygenase n=1 Tax=Lutibaculum baratangense AMV1 TaxID=631454 RepID=V4RTM9_9HYPH|nr:AbrB family transcriptional regulator [Lutibaculum baratangense]ESR26435.1 hypothetical protein N177_0935 [Lutibaculum baratangense AMV1]
MSGLLKLTLAVCGTMLISAAGGLVFEVLDIPVSWLSGGMIAVAVAGLVGVPVVVPAMLRNLVFFVMGLSIGSAVTPESLRGIGTWPASIVGMVATVVLITFTSFAILRWRGGWDRRDAFLASAPGALSLIVSLSESLKADVGRITLVQSLRVALLVLALPPMLRLIAPAGVEIELGAPATEFDVGQFLILAAGGVAGSVVCYLIRMQSPILLGSLLGSAMLHGTGNIDIAVPRFILIPALIAIGAIVGSRFRGIGWAVLRRSAVDGVLTFVATLGLALLAAAIAAELLRFPVGQTALAFAPGGFDVMTIMAFALGFDPAYVAAHHVVRFLGIAILIPLIFPRRRD